MMKRMTALCFIACILLVNSGCWNNRDLTEMAISTAIGIDRGEDGEIILSVQIVRPSALKSSGKGSGGGGEKSFVVVSNSADTIFGALRGMLSKVNQKIFYSSAQVIVIGEEAAKAGIKELLDFLQRDHESQYKTQVVITKGITAKEILEQEYHLGSVPGAYIADTLRNTEARGMVKSTMLIDVLKDFSCEHTEPTIGTILKDGNTTKTEGMAVFKKEKMTGWLDRFDTRGYMFITDRLKSTILEIQSSESPDKFVGIELFDSKSKMKLQWKGGRPAFIMNIVPEGNIAEQQIIGGMDEEMYLEKLEAQCNEKIRNEAMSVIRKCREQYKCDIFGFGKKLYRDNNEYWNTVSATWDEEGFPKVEIVVNVNTRLHRSGLLKEPIGSR